MTQNISMEGFSSCVFEWEFTSPHSKLLRAKKLELAINPLVPLEFPIILGALDLLRNNVIKSEDRIIPKPVALTKQVYS
jgi:hypothetical protein